MRFQQVRVYENGGRRIRQVDGCSSCCSCCRRGGCLNQGQLVIGEKKMLTVAVSTRATHNLSEGESYSRS